MKKLKDDKSFLALLDWNDTEVFIWASNYFDRNTEFNKDNFSAFLSILDGSDRYDYLVAAWALELGFVNLKNHQYTTEEIPKVVYFLETARKYRFITKFKKDIHEQEHFMFYEYGFDW